MENRKFTVIITLGLSLLLLILSAPCVFGQKMKIAVPSNSSDEKAIISNEMGRAPFFLLFDDSGKFLIALGNPARHQKGGISRTVAALLTENNISVVIGNSIGDKMKNALIDHDIQFIKRNGSVYSSVAAITKK